MGTSLVIIAIVAVFFISMFLYYRLKNTGALESTDEPIESKESDHRNPEQVPYVLQDPDTLLSRYRSINQNNEKELPISHGRKNEQEAPPFDEDEEAFQRAVEEVKKTSHAEDSLRMQWIKELEKETKRFAQKAQYKTSSPLMKRLNILFIKHAFLYLRVLVNLIDISIKMNQLNESHADRLDHCLSQLVKSEYERLNRIIVIHYLDLFLSDHSTTIMFDDTFTKRSLTEEVTEGLGIGKRETLLLQAIKTDTEYIQVLLEQLRMDQDKQLVNLAKTAFANTIDPLREKVVQEVGNSRYFNGN